MADGDRVVARVQWTGTQDGPYEGRPPTHNKLVFSTADFFRFENGKIAEHLGRGQCAPTHDCAWPDPAAGGCDGKAALVFAQSKRPGHFRSGRHELNSSNLRDQTQWKRRQVEPDPAEQAQKHGAGTPIPDWRERRVCSGCGSRDVDMVVTGTERR